MKTKNLAILFIFILVLATVLSAVEQKTCPVMGEKINKTLFSKQDGKRIYVCCEGCIDEVNKNFSKYENILVESGQSVEVVKKSECKDDCDKECCEPKKCDGSCKEKTTETPKKCCSSEQADAPKKCCSSK